MKNKLIVLLFVFISTVFSITANEGKRVAILPFTAKGQFDPLYAEVAQDNFTTELIKGNLYKVVERSQLDKAMKELKFQSGSDFDESSAVEIGKLAGAEVVAIGIITALKNQIVVNIRGINVKTGIAEFAERDFIKSQEEVLTAVEKIAKKLSSSDSSYSDTKYNIDFSMNDTDSELTESQQRFIERFFNVKLGIDPYNMSAHDIRTVYRKFKFYLREGVGLAVTGGVFGIVGITFLAMCWVFLPVFAPVGAIWLAGGITMGSCSVAPFRAA